MGIWRRSRLYPGLYMGVWGLNIFEFLDHRSVHRSVHRSFPIYPDRPSTNNVVPISVRNCETRAASSRQSNAAVAWMGLYVLDHPRNIIGHTGYWDAGGEED